MLTFRALGFESCFLSFVPPPLCGAISTPPTSHSQSEQFLGHLPGEHPLPLRPHLLYLYHLPGLQCPTVPAQYRAVARSHSDLCHYVASQSDCGLGCCYARPECRGVVLGGVTQEPMPCILLGGHTFGHLSRDVHPTSCV